MKSFIGTKQGDIQDQEHAASAVHVGNRGIRSLAD